MEYKIHGGMCMYYLDYTYMNDQLNINQSVNSFFEHINATGSSFRMNTREYMEYVGDVWNDKISSVRVAPKTIVILYEHRGFQGYRLPLINRSNSPALFNLTGFRDWNDRVSSIKTLRLC